MVRRAAKGEKIGHPRWISDKQAEQMYKLREKGLSYREIGSKFDVTATTAYNYCEKLRLKKSSHPEDRIQRLSQEIREMSAELSYFRNRMADISCDLASAFDDAMAEAERDLGELEGRVKNRKKKNRRRA